MQHPGINRAIPMGIIGFIVGALVVIVLRALQSMDPIWAAGPGIISGVLFTAGFFVWGMGGFDPSQSLHGEAAEQAKAVPATPGRILNNSVFLLATALIGVVILLFVFAAFPGGLALRTVADPLASTTQNGFFEMELFGQTMEVSKLVIFAVFVIFMFVSLAAVGWIIAWVFTFLNRGLEESKAEAAQAKVDAAALASGDAAVAALPAGGSQDLAVTELAPSQSKGVPVERKNSIVEFFKVVFLLLIAVVILAVVGLGANALLEPLVESIFAPLAAHGPIGALTYDIARASVAPIALLIAAAVTTLILRPSWFFNVARNHRAAFIRYAVVLVALHVFFYYIAIGLIMPTLPLTPVSLVNAVAITTPLLYPNFALQVLGIGASYTARFVRWLPSILQK